MLQDPIAEGLAGSSKPGYNQDMNSLTSEEKQELFFQNTEDAVNTLLTLGTELTPCSEAMWLARRGTVAANEDEDLASMGIDAALDQAFGA